jgi:hypothetical protein
MGSRGDRSTACPWICSVMEATIMPWARARFFSILPPKKGTATGCTVEEFEQAVESAERL